MRRDAKRQFEELFKPAPVSFTEAFDIGPGIRPAALLNSWGAAQGESHHVDQQMIVAAMLTRVFQIDKACKKLKVAMRVHRRDSLLIHKNRAKQFCHLTSRLFTKNSNR